MTLHKYLYCANEPINRMDLNGQNWSLIGQMGSMSLQGALTGALGGALGGFLEAFGEMATNPDAFADMSQGEIDAFLFDKVVGGVVRGALSGAVAGGWASGSALTRATATQKFMGAMYGAFFGNVGFGLSQGIIMGSIKDMTKGIKGGSMVRLGLTLQSKDIMVMGAMQELGL